MGNVCSHNDSKGYANMIDAILDVIFYFISAVIGLLPTWSIGHENIIVTLATALRTFDQYFPVTDMFEIISVYLAYYLLVNVIRPLLKLGHLA